VALAKKTIRLQYHSAERFHHDYKQLRKGHLFLPADKALPLKTLLALHITVPGIDRVFVAQGAVISSIDRHAAEKLKKPPGMLVAIMGGPDALVNDLAIALSDHAQYGNLLGSDEPTAGSEPARTDKTVAADKTAAVASTDDDELTDGMLGDPADADLSIEWLKRAMAQKAVSREKEAEPQILAPPTSEKKDLTISERKKFKPIVEFIMDLTNAMLRSGYYSPDNPGAQAAKRGLYKALQNSLVDLNEIMLAHQETREQSDIFITGILDEPVNMQTLLGAGMADLFVPKLREYLNRIGLVNFSIKKRISLEHFESFVDIMSDPKADRGEDAKVGELLSNALIEHGATETSTVFMEDIIALEPNLPWRVEMAIQRLAKDLKVLPMFPNNSDDAFHEMKLQIIQDSIQPLRHPELLKDFVINCHVIAKHVESVETEDIEKIVIDAFPRDTLLQTSRYVFEELNRLREMNAETPDNAPLLNRFAGVKRILEWISRRLVLTDARGAQGFLEQLHENEILTFEELPSDVQHLVNTQKIAKDVQAHFASYFYRILNADSAQDARVLIDCFRRTMPVFIENEDWDIALMITKAVTRAGRENELFSEGSGLPSKPHKFVFKDLTSELFEAYAAANELQRPKIERIIAKLGSLGIVILSRVLSDCDDRGARKDATDSLINKGDMARRWILKVLDDPKEPWYLQRNALMILRYVGKPKSDIDQARKLLNNAHPRLRNEALNTVLALNSSDAEQLVITALDDPDDKVRWRATSALTEISSLTDESVEKILAIIRTEAPEEKGDALKHVRRVPQLINCLGALKHHGNLARVEETILEIALKASEQKKGLLQRLKKTSEADQASILTAAIATLGKIGTPKSEAFLAKLAGTKTSQAEAARKAVEDIKLRDAQQADSAPAGD